MALQAPGKNSEPAVEAEKENGAIETILNFTRVTPTIVDVYITIIKQIHHRGNKALQEFIIKPLRGHYERRNQGDIEELFKTLELQRKLKGFKKMGVIYGKMLQEATYRPHPRDLLRVISRLLLDLEEFILFRETTFALEFIHIFRDAFYTFQKEAFTELEDEFESKLEDDIENLDASSMGKNELSETTKENLDAEAGTLFEKIERAYVMKDSGKLSYLLAQFTGRFCNYPRVKHRDDVDKIIENITGEDPAFRQTVKARLSIRLYQQIVSSIEKGDIRRAVRAIATFAITFQDDSNVPYRRELDKLEEKLYAFIGKHNLWNKVKVQ